MDDAILHQDALSREADVLAPPPAGATDAPPSPDGAYDTILDKWLAQRAPNLEMERSLELLTLDRQKAPLVRVGPVDVRMEIKLNVKASTAIEARKDKLTLKRHEGIIGLEKDIPLSRSLFGVIKEVKVESEIQIPDKKGAKMGAKPYLAKILGVELTFDTTAFMRQARIMHDLGSEPEKSIYDFYSKTVPAEKDTGDISLDFKTEFSINVDPSHLFSGQPERILTLQIDLKHPEMSLGGLIEWILCKRRPDFHLPDDSVLKKNIFVEPEGTLVLNLSTAGWARVGGGTAAVGGAKYLASRALDGARSLVRATPQVVSDAVSATRALVTPAAAVVVVGAVASTAALATLGRIAIGSELVAGRNQAIGYRFCQGYARMLARAVGFSRAQLDGEIRRFTGYDWRSYVEELRQMVHGTGGASNELAAQALELVSTCGEAAVLEAIEGLAGSGQGLDVWETTRHLHLAKAGAKEDDRYRYYLGQLYDQVNAEQPPEELGISLLSP